MTTPDNLNGITDEQQANLRRNALARLIRQHPLQIPKGQRMAFMAQWGITHNRWRNEVAELRKQIFPTHTASKEERILYLLAIIEGGGSSNFTRGDVIEEYRDKFVVSRSTAFADFAEARDLHRKAIETRAAAEPLIVSELLSIYQAASSLYAASQSSSLTQEQAARQNHRSHLLAERSRHLQTMIKSLGWKFSGDDPETGNLLEIKVLPADVNNIPDDLRDMAPADPDDLTSILDSTARDPD